MYNFQKIMYAQENDIPIRLTLTDGISAENVKVLEATYNDFVIEPPDSFIDECKAKGRIAICVLDYEDVESVEFSE